MGTYSMSDLLQLMVSEGAADLHVRVGIPPCIRAHGVLERVQGPPCTPEDTEELMTSITSEDNIQHVRTKGGADFGFAFGELARFRVSAFKEKGNFALVLRQIPTRLLTIDQIGLSPTLVEELIHKPRGMILVTGPTGSGKSTTLASMINIINETSDHAHIITVEDPIEFYHKHKKAVVTQREVHIDVPSFAEALRRALRQDPEIILVGELRDLETIDAALTAAETGHLVFGTLHTSSAAKTVDRIVDVFPAAEKEMVRSMLSESLRAVISQTLLKTKDGNGRIAAHEIMIGTPAIRNLIRENKVAQMYSAIQTGQSVGMQTMDQCLQDLVRRNLVASAEARSKAMNKDAFL